MFSSGSIRALLSASLMYSTLPKQLRITLILMLPFVPCKQSFSRRLSNQTSVFPVQAICPTYHNHPNSLLGNISVKVLCLNLEQVFDTIVGATDSVAI
jgi:hypothetical protein